MSKQNNFFLLSFTLRKICKNTCFRLRAFSRIGTGYAILSLSGKIRVSENPYSRIFCVLLNQVALSSECSVEYRYIFHDMHLWYAFREEQSVIAVVKISTYSTGLSLTQYFPCDWISLRWWLIQLAHCTLSKENHTCGNIQTNH